MINDDETLAQLSDYLDGAMAPADKSAFEARLAASAELRRELDELRAVRRAIKDLPREQLPDGFLSRFAARRARGDKPREDYVFLPPVMRPVALALSCGLIALVIWDKVTVGPETEIPQHPQYAAKVQTADEAPLAQYDFSKRAAGDKAASGMIGGTVDGKSLDIAAVDSERAKRDEVLPRMQEEKDAVPLDSSAAPAAAAPGGRFGTSSVAAVRGGARAKASGRPLEAEGLAAAGAGGSAANEPVLRDRTRTSMTEEERSARNEQMFNDLEAQKKRMGIAKVLPLDESALSRGVARNAAPAAPAVAAPAPTMLKKSKAEGKAAVDKLADESRLAAVAPSAAPAARAEASRKGRLSPDAGLVFSEAASLHSSWILLGFPGVPPSADFTSGRLVLIKPSATKIVSVTTDAGAVNIVYRSLNAEEEADPARDRVAPIPSEPKTVLFFDASPE